MVTYLNVQFLFSCCKGSPEISSFWTSTKPYSSLSAMFPDLDMMGYPLRVSNMPYDFFTSADALAEPPDDRHMVGSFKIAL